MEDIVAAQSAILFGRQKDPAAVHNPPVDPAQSVSRLIYTFI